MQAQQMKLDDLKVRSEIEEERRQKLQVLPDPMELARLAAALKPDLASGTLKQQQQAVRLARALFDLAVEAAVKPDGREVSLRRIKKMAVVDDAEVEQDKIAGFLCFTPEGIGEDELKSYLKKQHIKVPKLYAAKSRWGKFVKEYGFKVEEEPGQHKVLKRLVDKEVRQIKDEDAKRKGAKRQADSIS